MSLLELQVASSAPLDVRSFEVREAMSELFVVRVVALSHDPSLDLDRIVGHPASFHLDTGRAFATPRERRFQGLCHRAEQLRVEGAVFQEKDLDGPAFHVHASVTLRGPRRGRCGGGSFTTAQNMPRSRIALKNSWKSTGFTTKALTPSS